MKSIVKKVLFVALSSCPALMASGAGQTQASSQNETETDTGKVNSTLTENNNNGNNLNNKSAGNLNGDSQNNNNSTNEDINKKSAYTNGISKFVKEHPVALSVVAIGCGGIYMFKDSISGLIFGKSNKKEPKYVEETE